MTYQVKLPNGAMLTMCPPGIGDAKPNGFGNLCTSRTKKAIALQKARAALAAKRAQAKEK